MNPFTIVVLFIFGILIGYRANRLGRDFLIWMICSMIFTPILTWIALELSGKTDEKKEEEKKNLIPKNETTEEPDTEVITSSGNDFKFSSIKETDLLESYPTEEYTEEMSMPNDKQEEEEKPSETNETLNNSTAKEQVLTNEAKAPAYNKWFTKKVFAISTNQTQKIIYGISVFLITLILAYAIAENIDSEMLISQTWGVWIIFILVQAWFQNKLWNSDTTLNLILYFPNVTGLFHSIKSSTISHNIQYQTVPVSPIIKTVIEKPIQPLKNGQDRTTLVFYGLVALTFVLVIIAFVMKKDTPLETTQIVPSSDLPFVAPENKVIQSSQANITDANEPVAFKNETVSKLVEELQDGRVKTYDFTDPSSLGFKFKSTFPESFKYFAKKTATCQAGTKMSDSNGNTLVYTIALNESHTFDDRSSSQLDEALDATLNFQIENLYKNTSKSYEILDEGRKMLIGNFRAKYFEIFIEHNGDSEIKYSAIRSYIFYFKGGNGQINFCLRNNNKTQLKKDFSEYETLFQQIANGSELNKDL